MALDRPDEARKLAEEAIAGNPSLTTTGFMTKECVSRSRKAKRVAGTLRRRQDCQNSVDIRVADSCGYTPETLWNDAER